jgi:hypothetical protein
MPFTSGDVGELGFNVTTPAVAASTVATPNNTGVPVVIYILTAGTATGWTITDASGNAVAISATTGPPVGSAILLPPRASITITYSAAPTWKWYGVRQTN